MKVLIVSHYFSPHVGGIEIVAENQAKHISKKGHSVQILTSSIGFKGPRKQSTGEYTINRVGALNFLEAKFGIPLPLFSPLLVFKSLNLVRQSDVVHAHDVLYLSSFVTIFWAWIFNKPLIVTQHVAIVEHPNRAVMLTQKAIYNTIGKFLFKRAKSIVVYNTNVKDFLLKTGVDKTKISLVHNGVDPNIFSPGSISIKNTLKIRYRIPKRKPVVLFVGRLVPKKGFDIVAHASSEDYTTLIVGNGSIPTHLKKLDNVIFFGPATKDQLVDLYRLSDIFVFPAIGEIFTLAMQEAMACGLPVITTDDHAYKQYHLRRELISFSEREVSAIKATIRRLLNEPSLRRRMSQYSRELALEYFSWSKNYEEEFNSIYGQFELAL